MRVEQTSNPLTRQIQIVVYLNDDDVQSLNDNGIVLPAQFGLSTVILVMDNNA